MRSILTDFLHLFFPNLCLLCNNPLVKDEEFICLHCICRLPHTNYYKEPKNPVYHLFTGKTDITKAVSFLYFEKGNSVQKLIHQLKYYGNKDLGYTLGRMVASEYKRYGFFEDIDMIIPVPLHPARRKKRGYNQAEFIARGTQSTLMIPISCHILVREHSSTSQVQKNLYDRWLNTQNLFVVKYPEEIRNKHILLIDDVVTSGSTLSSCANTLLTAANCKVSILTIACAR